MSHTGIRIRINLPNGAALLEADSDWLHIKARMAMLDAGEITFDQLLVGTPIEAWHQIMGGPLEIWIQPVMLADTAEIEPAEYPDD